MKEATKKCCEESASELANMQENKKTTLRSEANAKIVATFYECLSTRSGK